MATMNKHLGWIQLLFMVFGLVFIYGKQVQSSKDIERRTTQCEVEIRDQKYQYKEMIDIINEIKIDIREIKTDLKYLRKGKNNGN